MVTKEDLNRVVRGPADLEERIEQLMKQKKFLNLHARMQEQESRNWKEIENY